MAQNIDYQAVLADLEARRDAYNRTIDKAIHAIRDILTMTAQQERPGQQPSFLLDSSVLPSVSSSVVNDDLKKKSLADASIVQLKEIGEGLTNQDLAALLEAVGFPHGSGNFPNLIGTALWRAMQRGKVYREGRKWYLPEWRRQRSAHGEAK